MNYPSLLQDYLSLSAEKFSDKKAILFGKKIITYKNLDKKSDQVALSLINMGLKRNDRVIIFLDNSIETIISLFGILKAGGIFIIVNSAVKHQKLNYILKDSETNIIITDDHKFGTTIEASKGLSEIIKTILINNSHVEQTKKLDFLKWEEIFNPHSELNFLSLVQRRKEYIDDDLAAILYTSGSTGEPKGVMCPHFNMVSVAKSIIQYLDNSNEDRILNVLPLSFGYGLYQVLTSVMVGGTIILEKSFMFPVKILQEIEKHKATGFAMVPTIAAILLNLETLKDYDLSSLRYLTNAGGSISVDHLLKLHNAIPKVKIFSMYGLTECQRVAYLPSEEIKQRPSSVGKPIPNCEIKIIDENGNEVPHGQIGELIVRGTNVMKGYWNSPLLTKKIFRNGGTLGEKYLYTGDLFHKDEDGFLYFHGRIDDMIKTKGERVSPKEIENIIYSMEGVVEAAVIGVPDKILGSAIEAIVVLKPGYKISEKGIKKYCAERLENFIIPKYVKFLNELPKNSNGKIDRKLLRNMRETNIDKKVV